MALRVRQWAFLIIVAGAVLGIDQISKLWISENVIPYDALQPVPALVPYFQITHSFNTGSAFGFMAGVPFAGTLFLVIAIIVSVVLAWNYSRLEDGEHMIRWATGLIIGGALGNAVDRMQHGHVIDFIYYQIPGVIANVSNLADHAIVLGVGLMLWASWQAERQAKPSAVSESAEVAEGDPDRQR